MAETVVIMAVRPLVSMLISKASSYLLDKYKVMEGMEKQLKILNRRLSAILDVIIDAEKQATAHREGAKIWLQDLKTVAYEANEVFDEFKYEALRREARKNGHYRKRDAIKLFPTHNRVVFRHKMGIKLCRILEDIEALLTDMQVFGFKYQPQPPLSREGRQTTYVIFDPQEIASRSRDKEKRNIVDTLLHQANNADLVVVPIVGMGGLGKTTLVQLIYNEPKIQKHFPLMLWVCVSENFDVDTLAKSIVEASPKKNEDTDKPALDRLQKLVSGQRYLLVLDDVWNREVHKWVSLKVCLQHGGSGSAVLTTTRDKQVAEMMDASRAYHLNDLDGIFLKEIIEATAFSSEKEKPTELVEMVGEIAERCCGSPLAATALGSVLRTKTSVDEWKALSSRSSICTEEIGILPILKLSYNDLPSYMKQCFAFCAIFPKDYKIDVEKLIQLWIANGFIPKHNQDSPETTGRHIFNELASRSFFLEIDEDKDSGKYYSRTTCKIHDLMHDIAMSVMEKECVVATEESSQTEWLSDTARHLFLSCTEPEAILNDSMAKRSPAIQTLLCDGSMQCQLQHPSKYSSLRALKLDLCRESFVLKPKFLHHLRYLDLSDSTIEALPEDIGVLYNLQVLDLSNCFLLVRLPRQMKYMTSLRHLYTHGCLKLKSMPPELGKLTKLQTLTYFVAAVNSPDCSDVAELEHLNLGGQLELRWVDNVIEAEAKVANLGNKKDLKQLALRWTSVVDSEVLSNFKPHYGLQALKIYSYGGKCMGMLQNMVEIHLFNCERLQVLFRCGTSFTFSKLKQLTLVRLLDLEIWWEINESQEGKIIFPVLEKLFIRSCGKLIALPEATLVQEPCGGGHRSVWSPFPLLEKLFLRYCRKLVALPEALLLQEPSSGGFLSAFPALKVLKLEDLESFQRWADAVGGERILFPRLEKLSIEKCPKLIDLPEAPKLSVLQIGDGEQELFHWVDRYLSSLTKLTLKLEHTETTCGEKCNSFFGSGALEPWNYFVHLGVLTIDRCDVLVHWPEKVFHSLVSLKTLNITSCNHLTGYTQGPVQPSASERSQHLPALESLSVQKCASLVEMFNVPASLKSMAIQLCSKLESIFGKQQLGTSELVQGSSCSEAIVPTTILHLSSSPVNHFCPCLGYLWLSECNSLSGVLYLPPFLKTIAILNCSSIQVLTADPSAEGEHSLPPGLRELSIHSCAGMLGGILRLPTSLKQLIIEDNSGLTSLEHVSGQPLSLERLCLFRCSALASLPNEPQAYRFFTELTINDCPAIKKLPRCLQQRLGNIQEKDLDAQLLVMAFKPKTWKEIPRLVRERKMYKRLAEQRRHFDQSHS
uniref:Uncharacterized protein n=1 Tax=Avena sativa TaxID=4498 RepID=A0ACD5ZGA7_AVESA